MNFRDAIRSLRSELGITQIELASALHINVTTVSRWELGQSMPSRAISSVLLDYANGHQVSETCIDNLRKALAMAAKNKLSCSDTVRNDIAEGRAAKQLKAIIDNINGGVSVAVLTDNDDASLAYANDGYYQLFGYTKEQFFTEIKTPHGLIYPDDMLYVTKMMHAVKETHKPAMFKYRAYKRDGSLIHVRCSSSVAPVDGLGDAVLMSVLTDITALIEAEERLRVQQRNMVEMMNATPGGIAVMEVDQQNIQESLLVTYYNDHFYSFSGYSREEYDELLKGDRLHLVFDEDKPTLFAAAQKTCQGELYSTGDCTVRCHTKDGGYRWLLLTGQLIKKDDDRCVINMVIVDITDRKEEQDRQRISEEMLRIAAETDSRVMLLYDVKTNSCRVESKSLFSAKFGDVLDNIPNSILETGMVAQESEGELRTLFERIRAGEEKIVCSLCLMPEANDFRWYECNVSVLLDTDNKPDHAILVLKDITEQRIKEAVFKKWQQSIETRPLNSYTLFRTNLSRDAEIETQEGELIKMHFAPGAEAFDSRTAQYAAEFVHPDDRETFTALLDAASLLARFYRGEQAVTLEYREVGENGEELLRLLTVEMVEYLHSTDVQVFLMYEDIDEKKKAELKEKELAETDSLTGALNRMAFAEKVKKIIDSEPREQHALIMMDLDGFKHLNDSFGHAAGDQALMDVVAALRSLVRDEDLLSRLGGDEFVIWLRNISYDAAIEKKAQQLCELVRKAYSTDVQISASVGVAVYPRDGVSFDELYRKADKALYKVKQAGKNSYSFVNEEKIQQSDTDEQPDLEVKYRIQPQPKRRMLVVDDDNISRAILGKMFKDSFIIDNAKNGKEAMESLRRLGSAVSIVMLDLTMPCMDGFEVLRQVQNSIDLRTIPVIVVSADDDYHTSIRAIERGAADYVTKPVDPNLVRIRVQSAMSKSENERLRAQNSYLKLQRDEDIKLHTVLESTGTVVIEYNWRNDVFIYDSTISAHMAGEYDNRGLWQVFLSDNVADVADVKTMQETLFSLINDRAKKKQSKLIRLRTPHGEKHWFRMNAYKPTDEFGSADKMIITFNDAHEEVAANEKLMFQATHDELTGLYNRNGFFKRAEELIASRGPGYYTVSCIDLEKFKVINDQYGSEVGDEVLHQFGQALSKLHDEGESACGRMMADIFAVIRPKNMEREHLEENHRLAEILDGTLPTVKFCVGRCDVDDKSLSMSAIFDRASIAKDTIKGRYDKNIATYDEPMRTSLLRQQELTGQMNHALHSGQFEAWLQPQFNHATGRLSGAEALVRWRHPEQGIISPSEFIPIFERNGFIYEVDKFVWEQACCYLRKWFDQGLSPVPISVNISRYDMYRKDIVYVITSLVDKYGLAPENLRLEITESAFSKSAEQIIAVVKQLVELGFVVEIDDFGSGYSYLNTLKDVPAQVIKMDMRFLENDSNSQRGGSIIESIVRMAKWLDMSVLAEGVETIEQADYLKSIGCEYVQGFLYSRPTKVNEYEELFAQGKIEPMLSNLCALSTWNNNAFWDPKSMESLIFNSYVGAACIFEYCKGKLELLRANDRYSKELDGSTYNGKPVSRMAPDAYLDEENKARMYSNIDKAIETDSESSCEIFFLRGEDRKRPMYIRTTVRVIARAGDRTLLYCVINNITTQRMAERKERSLSERIQAIMNHTDSGIAALKLREDERLSYLFINKRYYELLGYTPLQYAREVKCPSDIIVQEDYERYYPKIKEMREVGQTENVELRLKRRDGKIIWMRVTISIIAFTDIERPVKLICYTDIGEEKAQDEKLRNLNATMLELMNNTPGAFVQMKISPDGTISAEYCNDGYFEMVDMDRESTRKIFKNDVLAGVHPDDVALVKETVKRMLTQGEAHNVRCRLRHGTKGYIWTYVSGQTAKNSKGETVLNAYYTDATEQINEEEKQKELLDNLPYGAGWYVYDNGSLSVIHLNKRYWELVGRPQGAGVKSIFFNSVHPDDRDIILKGIQDGIMQGGYCTCKARILSADNTYRLFYIVGRIVQNDSGSYSIYAAHEPL